MYQALRDEFYYLQALGGDRVVADGLEIPLNNSLVTHFSLI